MVTTPAFVHPSRFVRTGVAMACTFALAGATPAVRAQERSVKGVLQHFQMNVNDYLALRWRATRTLPPLVAGANLQQIIPAIEAQVRAIRQAREDARTGDVFSADVAAVLRDAMAESLRRQRIAVPDLLAELTHDAPAGLRRPEVNDRLPWLRYAAMPVCFDGALPLLPYRLEFRLVGRDLVLLDVDLGLVVDVLPSALPPALPDPLQRLAHDGGHRR